MRLDLARLLGPLVAALVLVLILQQTLGALRVAGVWGQRLTAAAPATSPFTRIEDLLAPAAGGPPADPAPDPRASDAAGQASAGAPRGGPMPARAATSPRRRARASR